MKVGLIYPHQLFVDHPAMKGADDSFLIEEPLFFGCDSRWPGNFHVKKLILHRASMQAYLNSRKNLSLIPLEGARTSIDQLEKLPDETSVIQLCEVVDHVLEKRIREFAESKSIKLEILPSPNFVTPSAWGNDHFDKVKKPFMAKFYEAQRKRMGVLIDDDGKPEGGKWSFDEENRKKLPKKVEVPELGASAENDYVRDARKYIKSLGLESWGEESEFIYPISHKAARQWLEIFLEQRFTNFGTYEDALSVRGPFLFHSILTPMLNIGLLDPAEVVQAALEFGDREGVALNNIEGFVRQVIGWREYMKLMYQRHGVEMRNSNFWEFENDIPKGMYTGQTGILPVDLAVKNLQKHGYTHHIDRLMVLGNFCMLMRIKPNAVYQWFMDVFVDSYDWVMVPNVYGMSQFSDGGLLVTKPYISGSNYIRKMSDYPAGAWTEAWDSLFWTFVEDHREFFAKQYRMKMMLSHINKMGSDKLAEHYKRAADVRETLMQGKSWGEPRLL